MEIPPFKNTELQAVTVLRKAQPYQGNVDAILIRLARLEEENSELCKKLGNQAAKILEITNRTSLPLVGETGGTDK